MDSLDSGTMVLIFIVITALLSFVLLHINKILSYFLNRNCIQDRTQEKQFECGLNPTGGPAQQLSVSYFLIAAAFLIFELEGAILFAWAVNYQALGIPGMIAAVVFMIILLLGLFYMLAKGALKI